MNAIVKLVKVFICALFFVGPLSFTLIPEINASEQQKSKCYYFGATWCPPCKKMKNLFKDKEVAKEISKFDFQMYDIDKSPDLKKKYKVTKIPTLIFINKEKQTRHVGLMSKQQLLKILSEKNK